MCSFLIEYIIFSLSCTVARARRKVPSVENINKYVFIKYNIGLASMQEMIYFPHTPQKQSSRMSR